MNLIEEMEIGNYIIQMQADDSIIIVTLSKTDNGFTYERIRTEYTDNANKAYEIFNHFAEIIRE